MPLPADLLDPRGMLAAGALVPAPDAAYIVFGQATPAPFDVAVLRAYASRFVGAKVGFTMEKQGDPPLHDLAFVLVHTASGTGTVAVEVRAATEADRALAVRAEAARPQGLADLAARCPRVFVVHREPAIERVALVVACVLAGTSLGPIVDLRRDADARLEPTAIFGVRTARERLDTI